MENHRVEEVEAEVEKLSTTEIFNQQFVSALMYGMSYDEFWHDEAELFWAYRTSFYKKQEFEQHKINAFAWLSGVYYLRAMIEVDSGGKTKYPREPFDMNGDKLHDKKEKSLKDENEHNIKSQIANAQIALMRQEMKNKKEK